MTRLCLYIDIDRCSGSIFVSYQYCHLNTSHEIEYNEFVIHEIEYNEDVKKNVLGYSIPTCNELDANDLS